MPDAAQPWTDESPAPAASDAARSDPLSGDWSEGLLGAARDHGLPLPQRIQAKVEAGPAGPVLRRAAEELVAEAAGRLPAEALRTEQASAAALFVAEQKRTAAAPAKPEPAGSAASEPPQRVVDTDPGSRPPSLDDSRVALPHPALPVAAAGQALEPAAPSEINTETMRVPAPDILPPDVAEQIQRALLAETAHRRPDDTPPDNGASQEFATLARHAAPPEPAAPSPVAPPAAAPAPAEDVWAQATSGGAGPDIWAPSSTAPAAGAWEAGPAAAAGPDWGSVKASPEAGSDWEPPPLEAPAAAPQPPAARTDPTLMSMDAAPLPGDEDLPVPVPDPEPLPAVPGRPAYLQGEPRVVVHTLAGRVKRGTLRSADLGQPEIRLTAPTGSEERIAIGDVKAVFFMLAPGEQPPSPPGGRVRITLSDGRQLDGFRESDGPGGGLFIVPVDASRTNTRAIFVCGDAIQTVDHA